MGKRRVLIGLLGSRLDRTGSAARWESWRPTVDLCRHEELVFDRLDLIYERTHLKLAQEVAEDIRHVSPETNLELHQVDWTDPWDFEEVYASLHTFATAYPFDLDREEYLVHITTGTHVAQICCFLLTESRHFPARLLQSSPPKSRQRGTPGAYTTIDLDLSRYDRLASRFAEERQEGLSFLKSGIETKSEGFNQLIEQIERVAIASTEPLLLTGPTGAGKSQLARRIYELKRVRNQLKGPFVEVNCATIRGDGAMSALFGHVKGAYTGALNNRPGLLKSANAGVLFLDEIGELGLDEQAMLLRAVEEKAFFPVGTDQETSSDFQLIVGTNRNLTSQVRSRKFREDLYCRINLWTFRLPGLTERREDLDPNIDYELSKWQQRTGTRVTINKEARHAVLRFATSEQSLWPGNFRDFNAAMVRMATLAKGGRINHQSVTEEIDRLKQSWGDATVRTDDLTSLLGPEGAESLDRFDRVQLADVVAVCKQCKSMSEAGRTLFAQSRQKKRNPNDADRLRKYLSRFRLDWAQVVNADPRTSRRSSPSGRVGG